jgi:hypothetical protein
VGVAAMAATVLAVSFFGLSFWQELEIVGAIGVLTGVGGLALQLVAELGKRREEKKQAEKAELDERFREIRSDLRSHWQAIDARMDVLEERFATHGHPSLDESIKEILELAIANKAKLEFFTRFDELRQDMRRIKQRLDIKDQDE